MLFSFDYQPFLAVIGDIRGSRDIGDRGAVQKKLQTVLDSVNRDFEAETASRFMITLGDEFQGLLTRGGSALYIIDRIEREMFPVRLRFGLGVGEITTEIKPDIPLGTDGPAYYLARDAIQHLKAGETKKKEPRKSIEIRIQHNDRMAAVLNSAFALFSALRESWTERQVEIINAYLACGGTQADAARALGIHQPNVTQALAAANYYTYHEALDTLSREILSEIREADHE